MGSFGVASPQIVSEIIDGEAVILDLRCGRYWTTDGVGAEVWRVASEGLPRGRIVLSCRNYFPDHDVVENDVHALLDDFVAAGLLVHRDESMPSDESAPKWPPTYTAPVLQCYDDLADMMALDPVHDVGATGWPTPLTP